MPECRFLDSLVLPPSDRVPLIGEASRLEWLTMGWMTVEAAVAIAAGWMASSLVLTAFGLDSLIELASASVLIWRLSVELRHGQVFSERAEPLQVASAAACSSYRRLTLHRRHCGNCGKEPAKNSPGPASSSR